MTTKTINTILKLYWTVVGSILAYYMISIARECYIYILELNS